MAGRGRAGQRETGLEFGEVGLVGNIADRAAFGARAKQRALRTFKHFDAFKIGHVNIEVTARNGYRGIVKIDGDGGAGPGHGRRLDRDLRQRKTADRDRLLPRTAPAGVHLRQFGQQLIEIGDPAFGQLFAAKRLHRHRHILHLFAAPGGGNNDIGDPAGVCLRCFAVLSHRRRGPHSGQNHCGCSGGKQLLLHVFLPKFQPRTTGMPLDGAPWRTLIHADQVSLSRHDPQSHGAQNSTHDADRGKLGGQVNRALPALAVLMHGIR